MTFVYFLKQKPVLNKMMIALKWDPKTTRDKYSLLPAGL